MQHALREHEAVQPSPSLRRPPAAPDLAPEQPIPLGRPHLLRAPDMLRLQASAGNQAVSALVGGPVLQRGILSVLGSEREQYDDARAERQEFIDDGFRGPEDFVASTGRGGFEVDYNPRRGVESITLRGSVEFKDGIVLNGAVAEAQQPSGSTAATATWINSLPRARRAAEVAKWAWGDDEKTAWIDRYRTQIETVWSGQYEFHCTKRYWEDLGAKVKVYVAMGQGPKQGDDHMGVTSYKVPAGTSGAGVVSDSSLLFHGATDNTMALTSVDVEQRTDNILDTSINFQADSDALATGQDPLLDQFAIRFRSGTGPSCSICGRTIPGSNALITARIPGDGADPAARARARFDALRGAMTFHGLADAESRLRFEQADTGSVGHLVVGTGVAQIIAAHEAGHMFGLDDEYGTQAGGNITGSGGDAGTPSDHDASAQSHGLGGAVHENNDNIMSFGNVVQPQHYTTFLEALQSVTDMDEWAMGGPEPVSPPGPVDGPLPQPPSQIPGGDVPGSHPAQPPDAMA